MKRYRVGSKREKCAVIGCYYIRRPSGGMCSAHYQEARRAKWPILVAHQPSCAIHDCPERTTSTRFLCYIHLHAKTSYPARTELQAVLRYNATKREFSPVKAVYLAGYL